MTDGVVNEGLGFGGGKVPSTPTMWCAGGSIIVDGMSLWGPNLPHLETCGGDKHYGRLQWVMAPLCMENFKIFLLLLCCLQARQVGAKVGDKLLV